MTPQPTSSADDVSMVERVARAIFRAGFHDDDADATAERCWTNWPDARDKSFRNARAAVEAMREPTEAMIAAGFDAIRMEENWPTLMGRVWQAMIDTTLANEKDRANG